MKQIVIKRKKIGSILTLLFSIPTLMMFTVAGLMGLFDSETNIMVRLYFIFILGLMVFGLKSVYQLLKKIINSNPEFILDDNHLRVFDHKKYDSIPFSDMIDCKLCYPSRGGPLVAIKLLNDSTIEGNINRIQRKLFKIPKKHKNVVFISLDMAKIKADDFQKFLKERIKK